MSHTSHFAPYYKYLPQSALKTWVFNIFVFGPVEVVSPVMLKLIHKSGPFSVLCKSKRNTCKYSHIEIVVKIYEHKFEPNRTNSFRDMPPDRHIRSGLCRMSKKPRVSQLQGGDCDIRGEGVGWVGTCSHVVFCFAIICSNRDGWVKRGRLQL